MDQWYTSVAIICNNQSSTKLVVVKIPKQTILFISAPNYVSILQSMATKLPDQQEIRVMQISWFIATQEASPNVRPTLLSCSLNSMQPKWTRSPNSTAARCHRSWDHAGKVGKPGQSWYQIRWSKNYGGSSKTIGFNTKISKMLCLWIIFAVPPPFLGNVQMASGFLSPKRKIQCLFQTPRCTIRLPLQLKCHSSTSCGNKNYGLGLRGGLI